MKLTPDQLHRLIDEVAALAYNSRVPIEFDLLGACIRAGNEDWWFDRGRDAFYKKRTVDPGHAGLSAVLILLSEGG